MQGVGLAMKKQLVVSVQADAAPNQLSAILADNRDLHEMTDAEVQQRLAVLITCLFVVESLLPFYEEELVKRGYSLDGVRHQLPTGGGDN